MKVAPLVLFWISSWYSHSISTWLILIFKWFSQILILVSGISGLFSNLYVENKETGKRTLTKSGRIHLVTIVVGFILFGVTKFAEQSDQKQKASDAKRQIDTQSAQLEHLRKLDLARTHLAGLRISIEPHKPGLNQRLRALFSKALSMGI